MATAAPVIEITLKADAPTITKSALLDGEWRHFMSANYGDTVQFMLNTTVPQMDGYQRYCFTIHDEAQPGLIFDPTNANLIVKVDGHTLGEGEDYTLETEGLGDECDFRV